jgi:hypothetical protein
LHRLACIAILLLLGCNAYAVDGGKASGEQMLFNHLSSAYQPLRECVFRKIGTLDPVNPKIYSEIADLGALPEIEKNAEWLLGGEEAVLKAAGSAGLSDSRRVAILIGGLAKFDPHTASRRDDQYYLYRLLRQVTATSYIAKAPSVGCQAPAQFEYWMKEGVDAEIYQNLATEYMPYSRCVDHHLEGQPVDPAKAIVSAGLLPDLEREVLEYLGPSNPELLAAEGPGINDREHARLLLLAVGGYASELSNTERYGLRARRLMAINASKQLVASAMAMDCAPSENFKRWMGKAK